MPWRSSTPARSPPSAPRRPAWWARPVERPRSWITGSAPAPRSSISSMPSSTRQGTPFTVAHELRPRFRDTDAMGHVNNAVYVTYLEIARQIYWEHAYQQSDYRRVPFILAHVTIDFRSEALVSDVLEIGIRCEWIGEKSFSFVYRIWEKQSERIVA